MTLLERWASPEELQEVPPAEPWKFFRQRRGRHQELTEQRMEGNCQAMPAIRDRAMLEGKRAMVEVSAQRLRTCCRDSESGQQDRVGSERAFRFFIFKSLPGAGSALALRLNPGQPLS